MKVLMKTKNVLGAAVALALVAYAGTTWYFGGEAQKRYEAALAKVQEVLGPRALVSHQYERGFWTSKAKAVVQWAPPPASEGGADSASLATSQPIRLTVDTSVRNGPLVGMRLVAAETESRFSMDGLDASAKQQWAQMSAPTVTTVHHVSGSHDLDVAMPAGEISDQEQGLRWQPLILKMHVDASGSHLSGRVDGPEFSMSAVAPTDDDNEDSDDDSDESDADTDRDESATAVAAEPGAIDRVTMTMQGMSADFEMDLQDGLWMLAPGHVKGRIEKTVATLTPGDAEAQTLLALDAMDYSLIVQRSGNTLSWKTNAQTKGSVGPLGFDAITMEETVSRIDIEALKFLQATLVDAYQKAAELGDAVDLVEELAPMKNIARLLVASLPAYTVKMTSTLDGKQAILEYGIEIQKAPPEDQTLDLAWGLALLGNSVVHANFRLPKAWLPHLAQAITQNAMSSDQMDAFLSMAETQGYVRQEGEDITSALRFEDGSLHINGKPRALPLPGGR